jgi:hypothetical protein
MIWATRLGAGPGWLSAHAVEIIAALAGWAVICWRLATLATERD